LRRRYIVVKIESDHPVEERDFYDVVWTSILKLFGEYGASQAELGLVDYSGETNQAILRCSHKALDLVRASIVAVTGIRNEKAAAHILFASGTLKSLRRKLRSQKTADRGASAL